MEKDYGRWSADLVGKGRLSTLFSSSLCGAHKTLNQKTEKLFYQLVHRRRALFFFFEKNGNLHFSSLGKLHVDQNLKVSLCVSYGLFSPTSSIFALAQPER